MSTVFKIFFNDLKKIDSLFITYSLTLDGKIEIYLIKMYHYKRFKLT